MSGRFDEMRERMRSALLEPDSVERDVLVAVPYEWAGRRDVEIAVEQPEYTSVCPMTGLPDFGTVEVRYEPGDSILELQSFKFYLLQYRQVGIFYEHAANRILDDLVAVVAPRRMTVTLRMTARGGIATEVQARHGG